MAKDETMTKDEIVETIRISLEARENLLEKKMKGAKKRGDSSAEAIYVLTREIMEIERLLIVSVLVLR